MSEPAPAEICRRARHRPRGARGPFGDRDPLLCRDRLDQRRSRAPGGARRAEGTTVIASAQTAGRGRFGRTWFSPPGAGLYVSVICRDRARRAVSDAGGGRRGRRGHSRRDRSARSKSSGRTTSSSMPGADAGASWPASLPKRRRRPRGCSTSCSASASTCGRRPIRPRSPTARRRSKPSSAARSLPAPVLAATLAALRSSGSTELAAGNPAALLARWRELSPSASGAAVEWDTGAGVRSGRTAGIDDDGALPRERSDGASDR